MSNFGPSFTAARLYKKTSAKGGVYFVGRMGGVKIALLKARETAEDGGEIWNLVFSEAAPYTPKDNAETGGTEATAPANDPAPPRQRPATTQRQRDAEARRHWQAPAAFFAGREGAA